MIGYKIQLLHYENLYVYLLLLLPFIEKGHRIKTIQYWLKKISICIHHEQSSFY